MVLGNSQKDHASATSQVDFSPESLGVTHQETSSKDISGRSNISIILVNLQEHTHTDNNVSLDSDSQNKKHFFNGNRGQDSSMENENNNNSFHISSFTETRSEADGGTQCRNDPSKASVGSTIEDIMSHGQMNVFESRNEPGVRLPHPISEHLNDAEVISPQNHDSVSPENSPPSGVNRTDALLMKRGTSPSLASTCSSSDEDDFYEDSLLRDPKYNKTIEQGMKLGYPEKSVIKVLAKLGPECPLNDLLSELIKLRTSDPVLMLPGVDHVFRNETSDPVLLSSHIDHVFRNETSDPVLMLPAVDHVFRNETSDPVLMLPAVDHVFRNETSDPVMLSSHKDHAFGNEVLSLRRTGTEKVSLDSDDSCSFTSRDLQDVSQRTCLRDSGSDVSDSDNLCDIVIDGSNVAMSHGKTFFSCKGIQIAVDWFRARGHKNITVFVPQWRKEASHPDTPITDQEILSDLEKERVIVFTPSRRVKGRRVVCYDDRYILKLAVETSGIVVSNDVYRDLINENEDFRKVVDQRLLMYSFVNDRFMPPEDPLGRLGPTLNDFLCKTPVEPAPKPQDCPYGKKCTYGNKCRFYHPKRGYASQKSVTESLKEQAQLQLRERASKMAEIAESGRRTKQKLSRTKSLIPVETLHASVFPVSSDETNSRPKFGHSKSLLSPTKSSDYLNEPRRKLELAEHAAALEKASVHQDTTFVHTLLTNVSAPNDFAKSSKSSGLNLSALLQKDVLKENTLTVDSHFKNTSSLKSLSTNTSQVSTSLLTLPKAESHKGYLSGHLYLAKKLSDESSEGNFFSEHTSSSSNIGPQSPINPSGKITEQKQLSKADTQDSKNPQEDNSRYLETTSQYHNSPLQQQPAYTPRTDQYPGITNIPSLSIFEAGTSWDTQKCDSGILSPTDRYENSYMGRNVHSLSTDSGSFSSNYNSNQYQSQYENRYHLKSYPLSKAEEALMSQQLQCLHRTYNSIDNVMTSEDTYQMFGRRLSGFTSTHFGSDHSMLKPHHSIQTHLAADSWQSGHSHGLRRQNSNSDPQIHNINSAGKVHNVLPYGHSSGYSLQNFKDTYSSPSQQSQNQFQNFQQQNQQKRHHQHQLDNQDPFKRQQYEQDSSLLVPHLLSKPVPDFWGQTVNNVNQDYAPSPGGTTQNVFNPYQSHVQIHNTSNMLHFSTTTRTQNMTAANIPNYHLQHPQQHLPLSMMQSSLYTPASTSIHPQSTSIHPQSTSIHPQSTSIHPQSTSANPPPVSPHPLPAHHGFSSLSIYPQHNIPPQNKVHSFQPSGKSTSLNEDASIQPDNPCYPIYYHLSNVFGESIVRKVLNRNPGVYNPEEICKLIIDYKEGR